MNEATLIGRLGKDPEVRSLQYGGKVCNLSLATSERWKDKQTGERREATEWHRVTIFNENLIAVAERFTRKGSQILVRGKIKTRKWQDQSGADRYSTEIVLENFGGMIELLDPPPGNAGQSDAQERRPAQTPGMSSSLGYGDRGDLDDKIPF